ITAAIIFFLTAFLFSIPGLFEQRSVAEGVTPAPATAPVEQAPTPAPAEQSTEQAAPAQPGEQKPPEGQSKQENK
ncbi:MAG TPA: hypothetical protein VFQ92_23310, partial [Blastocatellia bacterium]|nr:hypothetical protein [Blastocatellia bacterium]